MSLVAKLDRRALLGAFGGLAAVSLVAGCERKAAAPTAAPLTDLKNHPVKMTPGGKLSIDDGRYLIALALIHPDPVSTLAAWSGDVNRISPDTYKAFVAKFPALATLPKTPPSNEEFNVEAVLGARPETAVVSLGSGPTDAQVAQLEGAGVGVAFIDFFSHPFKNQAASLTLLGRLVGREAQATAFNAFRKAKLDAVASRVAKLTPEQRPTVFLEAHAGLTPDCCNSPGAGNIGEAIDFVGGRNIGADTIKQPFGKLSLEYVIQRDPDIYIATGGPHLAKAGGYVSGPGFTAEQQQAGLRRVTARRGIAELKAVREGRAHGLSHQLINSPIDVVAVEVLAKWIHPELFADLDPKKTLNDINTQFLAVPYAGDYWADLQKA